jgi:hypothetical protein
MNKIKSFIKSNIKNLYTYLKSLDIEFILLVTIIYSLILIRHFIYTLVYVQIIVFILSLFQ